MSEERIPTELWVMAQVRQGHQSGRPAFVLHRGEARAGSVLLKINQLGAGCRLLTQVRDAEGRLAWMMPTGNASASEAAADAYIERAVKRDPDLWVVEVESRDGTHPFEGKEL
jgi:hypothetical protein